MKNDLKLMYGNRRITKFDFAFLCVILIQIVIFCIISFSIKKEYFGDEIWSFGLANNHGHPHLFMDENGDTVHIRVWESADYLREYVSVQEGERFDFGNVYSNCSNDLSAPLYFFGLHTISSFFPNSFSMLYHFPLMLIALVVGDVFFALILRRMSFPDVVKIACFAMYCFCLGSINQMSFFRQYCLLTAFCNVLLYMHACIYQSQRFSFGRRAIGLVCCTFFGGLTHYYFYVFAFIVAGITCLVFLFRRQLRDMLVYGGTMLAAAVAAVAAFPFLLRSVESHSGSVSPSFPFHLQLRMFMHELMKNTIGISVSLYPTGHLWMALAILVFLIVLSIPIFFLFRERHLLKKLLSICSSFARHVVARVRDAGSPVNALMLVCLIEIMVFIAINAGIIDYFRMSASAIRYLFLVIPSAVLLVAYVLNMLFGVFFADRPNRGAMLCALLLILLTILSDTVSVPFYLGTDGREGTTLEDIHNANIIVSVVTTDEMVQCAKLIAPDNHVLFINADAMHISKSLYDQADPKRDTYFAVAGHILLSQISVDVYDDSDDGVDGRVDNGNEMGAMEDRADGDDATTDDAYVVEASEIEDTIMNILKEYFIGKGFFDEWTEIGEERTINWHYHLIRVHQAEL